MHAAVKATIARHRLIQPGDRIGVAVSGGADSVALLLSLQELSTELGTVLSVVHFHHGIRGAEADGDENFVKDLAEKKMLEFHSSRGDAPSRAEQRKESLETAARELRYECFRSLIEENKVNKIALAHTLDDQAETVLMRFLRGAGTKGLSGIYPSLALSKGTLIRPLLETTREQIEAYLRSRNQPWREDATNSDTIHTRNKVRHELLPKLREFNPAVVEALARSADVARAEEDYWQAEAKRLLPMVLLPGKATRGGGRAVSTSAADSSSGLDIEALRRHPLSLQRRLIRAAAEVLDITLDAAHVETVLAVAAGNPAAYELPGGWRVKRSHRELRFERSQANAGDAPKQGSHE